MIKRILLFNRINSSDFPGGDTVQIKAIYNFLLNNGYTVHISDNPLIDLGDFDLIFIFNLTNPLEACLFAKSAERYSKPYILFPIYWNLDTFKYSLGINPRFIIKNFLPNYAKWIYRVFKFIKIHYKKVRLLEINPLFILREKNVYEYILKNSKYICPNSVAEYDHLESLFSLNKINKNIKVIYNGVDIKIVDSLTLGNEINIVKNKYKLPSNYICCVGGIGPRKNQLNLVKAANETGIPVVIIGNPVKGYEGYFERIKQLAKKNVLFLGHLPQSEIFHILKNSSGHIQPSYIETPGLASLEASAIGCPICVSNTSPVIEYFENHAIYCDPNDINSISKCLKKLFYGEVDLNATNDIRRKFDWNKTLMSILPLIKD
jgi:glycosyltransferase involved in cell wall biosynthesis